MSDPKLVSKIPDGPLKEKWSKRKAEIRIVSPNNKRKLEVIVVGTGLGGASAAASLGEMGCNVTGNKVSECRIPALEIVVAVLFGDLRRLHLMRAELLYILEFLGNPDAAVVTERLGHEGELALLVSVDRDAGRMDLREAGIGEECTPLVALQGG